VGKEGRNEGKGVVLGWRKEGIQPWLTKECTYWNYKGPLNTTESLRSPSSLNSWLSVPSGEGWREGRRGGWVGTLMY
jgi:hypothetical protein